MYRDVGDGKYNLGLKRPRFSLPLSLAVALAASPTLFREERRRIEHSALASYTVELNVNGWGKPSKSNAWENVQVDRHYRRTDAER
jgi:hypothetical protein